MAERVRLPRGIQIDFGDGFINLDHLFQRTSFDWGTDRSSDPIRPGIRHGRGTISFLNQFPIPEIEFLARYPFRYGPYWSGVVTDGREVENGNVIRFQIEGAKHLAGELEYTFNQLVSGAPATDPDVLELVSLAYGSDFLADIDPIRLGAYRFTGPAAAYISTFALVVGAFPMETKTGSISLIDPQRLKDREPEVRLDNRDLLVSMSQRVKDSSGIRNSIVVEYAQEETEYNYDWELLRDTNYGFWRSFWRHDDGSVSSDFHRIFTAPSGGIDLNENIEVPVEGLTVDEVIVSKVKISYLMMTHGDDASDDSNFEWFSREFDVADDLNSLSNEMPIGIRVDKATGTATGSAYGPAPIWPLPRGTGTGGGTGDRTRSISVPAWFQSGSIQTLKQNFVTKGIRVQFSIRIKWNFPPQVPQYTVTELETQALTAGQTNTITVPLPELLPGSEYTGVRLYTFNPQERVTRTRTETVCIDRGSQVITGPTGPINTLLEEGIGLGVQSTRPTTLPDGQPGIVLTIFFCNEYVDREVREQVWVSTTDIGTSQVSVTFDQRNATITIPASALPSSGQYRLIYNLEFTSSLPTSLRSMARIENLQSIATHEVRQLTLPNWYAASDSERILEELNEFAEEFEVFSQELPLWQRNGLQLSSLAVLDVGSLVEIHGEKAMITNIKIVDGADREPTALFTCISVGSKVPTDTVVLNDIPIFLDGEAVTLG